MTALLSRLLLPLLALPILQAPVKIETCHAAVPAPPAPIVVQLTGHWVKGPDSEGLCTLTGPVARSFQGPLPLQTLVQVDFPCGAASSGTPAGQVLHDPGAVAGAGAVEVHATAEAVVAYGGQGLLLLDALTAAPVRDFVLRTKEAGGC